MMNDFPDDSSPITTIPRPQGLLRLGLRLPIWLYRLHLGWLLGQRFLLLKHIGRKSGRPRQTVLEVIRYDKATDRCLVASGWGSGSDWFRNIQHIPEVTIFFGRRQIAAQAIVLSEMEGADELLDYATHHPQAFQAITRLLAKENLAGTAENCHKLAKIIPIVAFRPRPDSSPNSG